MAHWTEDQQKAIDTNGKDILVAAAAGSGKTAVLVERVISHVLLPESDPDHWDVDKLLVVTFTQAAAAEMRQRIELQLQKAILEEREKKSPDENRIMGLERQIILLSNATISTIHSFCQNVIRQNFTILKDFDPSFRVIMENENDMLKQDVLDKVLERYYEEGNEFILDFAAKYGDDKRGDEAISSIVLDMYGKACNQLFPEKWLRDIVEPFNISDDTRIFNTKWGRELATSFYDSLQDGINTYTRWMDVVSSDKNAVKLRDFLADRIANLNNIISNLKAGNWDGMILAASSVNWGRWPGIKDDKKLNEQGKNANDSVKKSIKNTFDVFAKFTEEMLLDDIRKTAPEAAGISQLVQDFMAEYAARKREKNVIDFNDMEHIALKILMDPAAEEGKAEPSSVALEMREHYQEIMVDEYQDTNEVQDAIIRLVAGPDSGRVFTVGDVKQSIYRFRSAEPSLFQNLYKEYDTQGNPVQELICLSKNFRSRREVLDGINYVFGQCMTEESMDIDYDERAALYCGLEYGEPKVGKTLDPAIDIMLVDIPDPKDAAPQVKQQEAEDEEPVTDMRLEANMIAKRLREIHDSGVMVYDKEYQENNHYRPIKWKDMVILSHALKGERSNTLMKALQDSSIPAYSMKGDGYFDTLEIRIMTALLSIIDNARQDIPLAAVLHSPIVGLTETELAKLRLNCPEGDFFDVLLAVNSPERRMGVKLKSRIAKFLQQLSDWRRLSRQVSVAELIWQLYRDTGYYDFVGGLPGGLIRQANLRSLITYAEEFQSTDYKGLFRFLQFIRRMKDMENDLEVARTLGESEDVVRIMTIHKSKGLEFPVVVVAGMQKQFNASDSSGDIIASKKLGLGIKRTDLDTFQRYNTISNIAVSQGIRRESIAEELRVLYVAMTRAREKLILTGFVKKLDKRMENWCTSADSGHGQLSKSVLHKAKNFLDWVMPAVVRHPDLAEKTGYSGELGHVVMGLRSHWSYSSYSPAGLENDVRQEREITEQLRLIRNGEMLPLDQGGSIADRLNWQYDFGGTMEVPGKLSVTELKRRFAVEIGEEGAISLSELPQSAVTQEYSFPEPAFLHKQAEGNAKHPITGAEYGTLMHNVMQHLDTNGSLTMKGIARQLDDMAAKGIILPEQKAAVNLRQVANFFKTDIGQRLLASRQCWRELPFSRMLKAKDFYHNVTDDTAEIFSQGVIDVLFEDADGKYIILDYKTDRNTEETSARERYKLQLVLYSQAVENLLGVKVAERYLYMLRDGKIIAV